MAAANNMSFYQREAAKKVIFSLMVWPYHPPSLIAMPLKKNFLV